MSRAAYTILLIQAAQLARADFADGELPKFVKCWRGPRPELSLAELVQEAIKLGPACGKNVFVLCEDLWTQVIAFPVAAVSGLDDTQLLRSCAFESEPLSGIPAMSAVMGMSSAEKNDELRTFWFTSMDSQLRDQIQQAVRRHGAKLAGIAHPGGACAPVVPATGNQPWSRVEIWRQLTLCISGNGHTRTKLQIINASSAQKRVQASVTAWMVGVDVKASELLDGDGKPDRQVSQSSSGSRPLTLLSDADLAGWFKAWMGTLTLPKPPIPMISAAVLPIPRSTYLMTGLVAELIVASLCYLHWFGLHGQTVKYQADAAELQKSAARVAELDKKSKELLDQTAKLAEANEKALQTQTLMQRDVVRKRAFVSLLLKSVAAERPDEIVVEKLSASGDEAEVHGLALQAQAPDDFVARLEPVFKPLGLIVQSRGTDAGDPADESDTWAFSLGISPVGRPMDVAAQPAPVKRRRIHN